jgi:hypothetical protein
MSKVIKLLHQRNELVFGVSRQIIKLLF